MAGKTDSRYITVDVGGLAVECSINNLGGVGVTNSQIDITTLCNTIMEMLQGVGDLNLSFAGPFDNGVNGMYTVIRPLATAGTLSVVTIAIGINAAPTTGDPEFVITNGIFFDYIVAGSVASATTDSVTLRGGQGITAVWGTVT